MGSTDNLSVIDADTLIFLVAYNLQHTEDIEECYNMVDTYVTLILHRTNATHYLGFLGSGSTFRNELYPLYKSKRPPKPEWMTKWNDYIRSRLIYTWGFVVVRDIEAEDAAIITATKYREICNVTLCYVDKDLDFYCGNRYNYRLHEHSTSDLMGELTLTKGKLKGKGLKFYYAQLITGDMNTDCVPGLVGKGPTFAYKLLDSCTNEYSLLRRTYSAFLMDSTREHFILTRRLIKMLDTEEYGFVVPEPVEYIKKEFNLDDLVI